MALTWDHATPVPPDAEPGTEPTPQFDRFVDSGAVPDVLIYADSVRSPEMRHQVPITIPDPFLYLERNGESHVCLTSFEIERVRAIPDGQEPHG